MNTFVRLDISKLGKKELINLFNVVSIDNFEFSQHFKDRLINILDEKLYEEICIEAIDR